MENGQETERDVELNKRIAWILRTAVTVAFLLTLAGYVFLLTSTHHIAVSCKDLQPFPPSRWHHSGPALLMTALGVLGFIAVPVSRVVYSAFYFLGRKNLTYALLSFYVFLMVGIGILVGSMG